MRRYRANGTHIKKLRLDSDKLATQKEFAHALGVSERKLRKIENENDLISRDIAERLGKLVSVPWQSLIFSAEGPQLVQNAAAEAAGVQSPDQDLMHVPRYDDESATVVRDAGKLYDEARTSHAVISHIQTTLTSETEAYADKLLEILGSLGRQGCGVPLPLDGRDEIALRRRVRELLVLLKGNDVWVYATSHWKNLPESDTPISGPPTGHEFQLIIAFGPRGEYGEETVRVPVDNGHPRSFKNVLAF